MIHLAFRLGDGSLHHVDIDLNVPSVKTSNIDQYDGSTNDYILYLMREKPVYWREEMAKQEDMTSARSMPGVIRSVRFRAITPEVVLPSQVTTLMCIKTADVKMY